MNLFQILVVCFCNIMVYLSGQEGKSISVMSPVVKQGTLMTISNVSCTLVLFSVISGAIFWSLNGIELFVIYQFLFRRGIKPFLGFHLTT